MDHFLNNAVGIKMREKDDLCNPDRKIGQEAFSIPYEGCFGYSMIAAGLQALRKINQPKYENELSAFQDIFKNDLESVNHVKLIDWVATDIKLYLATERTPCNLRSFIKKGEIPKDERIKICFDTAKGLNFLHEGNILHGYLDPENVLIFENEFSPVKIIAKLCHFEVREEINCPPITEIWMSPEQIIAWHENETIRHTKYSDVFCLGMTFYFAISGGEHPFATSKLYGDFQIKNIRDPNVWPVKLVNELKDYTVDHLLIWMMQNLLENRPSINQVVKHPVFWDDDNRFLFLFDITCQLDPRPFKCARPNRRMMDYRYNNLYNNLYKKTFDWTQIATNCVGNKCSILKTLRFSKYNKDSIVAMLKFFRDEEIVDPRGSSDFVNNLVKFRLSFLVFMPELIIFLFCSLAGNHSKSHNSMRKNYCKNYENADISFLANLIGDWEES